MSKGAAERRQWKPTQEDGGSWVRAGKTEVAQPRRMDNA